MYCAQCRCEFEGWTAKCPNCTTPLVMRPASASGITGESLSYDALLDLVRANGGRLTIDISTIAVERERKHSFPHRGYGRAWARKLQGTLGNALADLNTTEVGRDRRQQFPYQAYGFAWANGMRGTIGGNEVNLAASRVKRETKWRFPYRGYGYAWTEEMSGECGDRLYVELVTTDVGKHRGRQFPYFAYGYAWANKATLTLTLKE